MAYNGFGHYTRVNYYSNPSVMFPITNTATGVAGKADNARVITMNRWTFLIITSFYSCNQHFMHGLLETLSVSLIGNLTLL